MCTLFAFCTSATHAYSSECVWALQQAFQECIIYVIQLNFKQDITYICYSPSPSFFCRSGSGWLKRLCLQMHVDLRSDSGMELLKLGDELEVIVLNVGLPVNGRPYSARVGGHGYVHVCMWHMVCTCEWHMVCTCTWELRKHLYYMYMNVW